jgi:hypothetical protein
MSMDNSIPSMILSNAGPAGKMKGKSMEDYEICSANGSVGPSKSPIGTGSFSEVKLVRDKRSKELFALKIVTFAVGIMSIDRQEGDLRVFLVRQCEA